jgi:hypothetical protein
MGRISTLARLFGPAVAAAALGLFAAPMPVVAAAGALSAALPAAPATKVPSAKAPGTPAAASAKASSGSKATTPAKATAVSGSKVTTGGKKPLAPKSKPKQKPGELMELDWRDLLPEDERSRYSASAPPPEHGPLGEGGPPALQRPTTTVNGELADFVVRMPGFVVPIGTPRDGLITEFLLVPYIGACIHVPPPPANQMVYVTSASGIAADAVHEAYWVTGKMRVESRTTALGTAAYAVEATKVDLYEY